MSLAGCTDRFNRVYQRTRAHTMMKHGLLAFGLGLATCVLPAARNACFAQESAPSTPRANQPNAPQNFAVHDLTATAASDPMTGWSEPRGLETPAPVTVSHGRYAASAIALPAQMMPARVARPDEFVVDDNLSATVRHVADEASQLTTEGLKLAGKGAVFSARARFIGVSNWSRTPAIRRTKRNFTAGPSPPGSRRCVKRTISAIQWGRPPRTAIRSLWRPATRRR